MGKRKEDGYAVLMYPKSKMPYLAGEFVAARRFATVIFFSKETALQYRKDQNILRKSKTVPVHINKAS